MNLEDMIKVCSVRGVSLVIAGGQLRARGRQGSVNDALKQALAVHKQAIIEKAGEGIWLGELDGTLPDDIRVPKQIPNTLEANRACVEAQRRKEVA